MKISADPNSPDYFRRKGFKFPRVFLDGDEQRYVRMADDEAGTVTCYLSSTASRGKHTVFVVSDGEVQSITKRGKVRIFEGAKPDV